MSDDELIARMEELRPWWWWLAPWFYIVVVENYLRDMVQKLVDERATVVSIRYRCTACGRTD
jgi:hypothetical protein